MSAVEQSNSDAWRIDMTDEERCYYVETLEQIRLRCKEKCYSGEVEALDVAIENMRFKPVMLQEHDAEPRRLNAVLDTETMEVYVKAALTGFTIEEMDGCRN